MKLVMTIHVILLKHINSLKGPIMDICMLPFTCTAEGEYFNGTILGEGIDTQKIYHDGSMQLSARYMLSGKDFNGKDCCVFIENNGKSLDKCVPMVITDSPDLQFLSESDLVSTVTPNEQGVTVQIFIS